MTDPREHGPLRPCVVCGVAKPCTPDFFTGRYDMTIPGLRYSRRCRECEGVVRRRQQQAVPVIPAATIPETAKAPAARSVAARPVKRVLPKVVLDEHRAERGRPPKVKRPPREKPVVVRPVRLTVFDEVLIEMEAEFGPYASWRGLVHEEMSRRVAARQGKTFLPAPSPRVEALDPSSPFYRQRVFHTTSHEASNA